MPDLNAQFPYAESIEIPDSWLDAHKTDRNARWDCRPQYNADGVLRKMFHPRGILFDRNEDNQSTTANIRGQLLEDNEPDIRTRTLTCNINHPRCYKYIYAYGTTARGIEIDG